MSGQWPKPSASNRWWCWLRCIPAASIARLMKHSDPIRKPKSNCNHYQPVTAPLTSWWILAAGQPHGPPEVAPQWDQPSQTAWQGRCRGCWQTWWHVTGNHRCRHCQSLPCKIGLDRTLKLVFILMDVMIIVEKSVSTSRGRTEHCTPVSQQ